MILSHTSPSHSWSSLQRRQNGCDSVSNHRRPGRLLKHLFRCRSKKTSKLRAIGFFEGNSLMTNEIPTQRASNAENVSIWSRHHVYHGCSSNNRRREIGVNCVDYRLWSIFQPPTWLQNKSMLPTTANTVHNAKHLPNSVTDLPMTTCVT